MGNPIPSHKDWHTDKIQAWRKGNSWPQYLVHQEDSSDYENSIAALPMGTAFFLSETFISFVTCFAKMPVISYLRLCCCSLCFPPRLQTRVRGLEYLLSWLFLSPFSDPWWVLLPSISGSLEPAAGKTAPGWSQGPALLLIPPIHGACSRRKTSRERGHLTPRSCHVWN